MLVLTKKSKNATHSVVRFVAKTDNTKEFEYYKTKEGFEFEIQEGQTHEQIRIHVHTIEKHLHDTQVSMRYSKGSCCLTTASPNILASLKRQSLTRLLSKQV